VLAHAERGAVLPLVLFALMLLGGLVAAALLPAIAELHSGRGALNLVRASAAAAGGVDEVIAHWRWGGYDTLGVGDSSAVRVAALASRAGWYDGAVYRLGPELYLIRLFGFSRDSSARQSVGRVVRMVPFDPGIRAALATSASVTAGPSVVLSGSDSVPPGWGDCPPPELAVPAIRLPVSDSAQLQTTECVHSNCAIGAVSRDGTLAETAVRRILEIVTESTASAGPEIRLAAGAYAGVAPVLSGGRCHVGESLNWGDPSRPKGSCADRFPAIEVAGDLHLKGGIGQGVLLVHGNLVMDSGAEFFGPVFVAGSARISGGTVVGGVLAGGPVTLDRANVTYSKCVLVMASRALGRVLPLGQRSWIDVQ
jgi:hypothetical protein